jgi:hypothetical protein
LESHPLADQVTDSPGQWQDRDDEFEELGALKPGKKSILQDVSIFIDIYA